MADSADEGYECIGRPAASLRGVVIRYRGHRTAGARPARITLPSATVTLLLGWGHPLSIRSGPEQPVASASWPAMIAGLQTMPTLAGFDGAGCAVEIELTPLGAYRLMNLPLHHLARTVVDPGEIMGAEWVVGVTERLAAAPHWPHRWQILDAVLTGRLGTGTAPSPAATEAWSLLRERGGGVSLPELALAIGLGRRRIQGLLREHVGLPAQTLSRILRFHRALAAAAADRPPLADLANLAGYHDQSHMHRDFRAFSGRTPQDLVRIMRRTPARHGAGHLQPFNDFGTRGTARRDA